MVAAFLCYIDRKKNVGEFGRTFVAVGRSVINFGYNFDGKTISIFKKIKMTSCDKK
jgi:hypothetical protein